MALSWVSGYFIYQLFNPILFQYVGAEVAGQMGMTMQVVNAIQAFAFSWMSTKIPIYSTYIAQRRYELLDILFQKNLKTDALCLFGDYNFISSDITIY